MDVKWSQVFSPSTLVERVQDGIAERYITAAAFSYGHAVNGPCIAGLVQVVLPLWLLTCDQFGNM